MELMSVRRIAIVALAALSLGGCSVVSAVPGCHTVAPLAGPVAPLAFGACFAATTGRTIHKYAEEARAQEQAEADLAAEAPASAFASGQSATIAAAPEAEPVQWGVDRSDD